MANYIPQTQLERYNWYDAGYLIAGDETIGYYGRVKFTDIISGSDLSQLVGFNNGVLFNNETDWLKFAYNGKALFTPMKSIRHTLSWEHLNTANLIMGRDIKINEVSFNISLWDGASLDPLPANTTTSFYAPNSQWNKLMLPIHIKAINGGFNQTFIGAGNTVENWNIGFTDIDLNVSIANSSVGYNAWVKNSITGSSGKLWRGYIDANTTIEGASSRGGSAAEAARAWRPILVTDITNPVQNRFFIYSDEQYYYNSSNTWISLGTNPSVDDVLLYGMSEVNTLQISQFEAQYGLNWSPCRYTDGKIATSSTIIATPKPQILTAKNSVQITGVVSATFSWLATGGSRVALSVDDGVTYHAYKNGIWIDVTNDMSNAMTSSEYSSLTWAQYELIKGESNFLKHQYYIPDNSNVDDILITTELMGTNRLAPNSNFDVVYDQGLNTININIKSSGSYFANVLDV